MTNSSTKLSFREKAGYSLGDASANFVFQTMIIFQMGFYTDVFGITPWLAGFLLVGVRLLDAVFDPIVGTLADRTNSRWGKFRPWVLFSAPFFGVIFWLTFTTPDFGTTGKAVYATILYIALMMIYSINNVPYSALTGVMTNDGQERTSLSSFRFVAATAATFVVQGLTLPLVSKFGGTNVQKGWSITFGIFAIIAVVFFVITFFSVKERVHPDPKQKTTFKDNLKAINIKPWYAIFVLTLFIFITLALRGGGLYYYFSYYVDKASLHDFLCNFGLKMPVDGNLNWWQNILNAFGLLVKSDLSNARDVGLGFNNMVGNLITILGVMCSPFLVARFGKKALFLVGLTATTIAQALIFFCDPTQVTLLFVFGIFWSMCYGPTIPVLWAMVADVADYSEWKTNYRATGFVFAGMAFALKAGLGFGGAINGWILEAYGYVANAVQTPHALMGIRLSASLFPAICFAIATISLVFYPISRKQLVTIQNDLEERRKKFGKEN